MSSPWVQEANTSAIRWKTELGALEFSLRQLYEIVQRVNDVDIDQQTKVLGKYLMEVDEELCLVDELIDNGDHWAEYGAVHFQDIKEVMDLENRVYAFVYDCKVIRFPDVMSEGLSNGLTLASVYEVRKDFCRALSMYFQRLVTGEEE